MESGRSLRVYETGISIQSVSSLGNIGSVQAVRQALSVLFFYILFFHRKDDQRID